MYRGVYAGALIFVGILGILSGAYEIVGKKRLFGREIFPRHAPHATDDWTPDRWRRNGFTLALAGLLLVGIGVAVLVA